MLLLFAVWCGVKWSVNLEPTRSVQYWVQLSDSNSFWCLFSGKLLLFDHSYQPSRRRDWGRFIEFLPNEGNGGSCVENAIWSNPARPKSNKKMNFYSNGLRSSIAGSWKANKSFSFGMSVNFQKLVKELSEIRFAYISRQTLSKEYRSLQENWIFELPEIHRV